MISQPHPNESVYSLTSFNDCKHGVINLEVVMKENAQNIHKIEGQFGNLTILNEEDNLKNVVYLAKTAKETQAFKLKTERELMNMSATILKQADEIKALNTLKFMDARSIQKQIDEIKKQTEDAKVHITGTKKAPSLSHPYPIPFPSLPF